LRRIKNVPREVLRLAVGAVNRPGCLRFLLFSRALWNQHLREQVPDCQNRSDPQISYITHNHVGISGKPRKRSRVIPSNNDRVENSAVTP
jgi:hypothetical protein